MRKLLALIIVAAAFVVATALPGYPHNYGASATCAAGLSVSATSYPSGSTIKITRDGTTLVNTMSFTNYTPAPFANPNKTVAHTWHVTIVSGDGNHTYDVSQDYTTVACETPPTTVPPVTTVPPTTTTDPGIPSVTRPPITVEAPVVLQPAFTG